MNIPKRPGPQNDGLISDTIESVLTAGAVVLMLASIIGLVVLISTAFANPRVGDMVVFRQGASVADSFSFTAQRTDGGAGCVLDPALMVQSGGSLVVEGMSRTGQDYRLHWAGGRTAQGADNCGSSAELTLSRSDLQTLVNAMGGRGIAGRGYVF